MVSEQSVPFRIPFSCLWVYLKTIPLCLLSGKQFKGSSFGLGTFIGFNISDSKLFKKFVEKYAILGVGGKPNFLFFSTPSHPESENWP